MRRPGRAWFHVCLIPLHLLCATALADVKLIRTHGQDEAPRPIISSDTASPTLMKETDYELGLRILKAATKNLQSDSPKVWKSGFTEIDRLLDHGRWGCHSSDGKWENLHLKADLLLASLTPKQREFYLLGAEGAQAKAKAELTSAQAEKNSEKLLRTLLLYANTDSGLEAWSQYAWQLADRGELLLAEVQYQGLLDRYKLLGKQVPQEIWYQVAQVFALSGNRNAAEKAWRAFRSAVGSAESVSIRGRTRLVSDLEKTIRAALPNAGAQRKILLKDFAPKLRAKLPKQEEEHFETALLVNPEAIYGLVREAGAFTPDDVQEYVQRWINREGLHESDPCTAARIDRKLGIPTGDIESINLSNSKLTPAQYVEILNLPFLRMLTKLEMNDGRSLGDSKEEFLSAITASPSFKNLTYLDLNYDYLGIEGAKAVTSGILKDLRVLHLAGNNLGFEGAKMIASTPNLKTLSHLYLHDNHFGAEGAKALAASPYLKNLTHLGLGYNLVGVEGVKALASSPNLQKLSYLDLAYNSLGNEGVQVLAASPHLKNLSHLDLGSNYLTSEAAQALASSPYLKNLTHLDLMGNQIGDEGLQSILESPYLTNLVELNTSENFRSPYLQAQLKEFLERNKKRVAREGKH